MAVPAIIDADDGWVMVRRYMTIERDEVIETKALVKRSGA